MPSYNWKGIDWYGNIYYGKDFARSFNDLAKKLLNQEIGLLSANYALKTSFFNKISISTKFHFFKDLSILTESGIKLHKALDIIANRTKTSLFNKIIEEIAFDIKEGAEFSQSMQRYPKIFDNLIIQIVQAGEESGKTVESLKLLSLHLEKQDKFLRKLRSALLLPAITFTLFMITTLIIFIIIIPSFSAVLSSYKTLPSSTQKLLNLSQFISNLNPILVITTFLFFLIISLRILKKPKVKSFFDLFLLKIPFLGKIIKYFNLAYFLQSVSLLLFGGVNLSKALLLAKNSINNSFINNDLNKVSENVSMGLTLNESFKNLPTLNCIPDLIEMINIGEESGNLGFMLNQAALIYFDKIDEFLALFLTVTQPILMIILGLITSLLIFSVYIPIFNLPNTLA